MLFDTSWFYDLLAVGFIAFIIWLVLKYKQARAPIVFCIILLLIGFTAYACIELNYYYTAEGGIFGKITGIFQTNTVEVSEQTFSFENMELTQENGDTYSLKITSDEVFALEDDQQFIVYVNNEPCYYVDNSNSNQYVVAKYSYTFLDENLKELCTDTLTFNFAFYTNSTYLSVKTEGGAEAVKYWNYYFNKNVFEVRIEKTDYAFDDEITFGDGDISEYHTITYYVKNEIYSVSVCSKDSKVRNFITPEIDDYIFLGWSIDGENIIEELVVNNDCSLYAVLTDMLVLLNKGVDISFENVDSAIININDYVDVDVTGKHYAIFFECGVMKKNGCTGSVQTILGNGESCFIKDSSSGTSIAKVTLEDNMFKINNVDSSMFVDIVCAFFEIVLYP